MRLTGVLSVFFFATTAQAEVPRVAVDIAPVHSLVAQVMDGVGTPNLILKPGASPHHYALRPSEASALAHADLVIWMGEGLTPWLGDAIGKLVQNARLVELLEVPATRLLERREGIGFAQAEPGNSDHESHESHEHHGSVDPHAWLDPSNAQAWVELIAAELATLDPANADRYRDNARLSQARIERLRKDILERLAPSKGAPFLVLHDAYYYFEEAFDMQATAAISLSDAAQPGPSRIAALRDLAAASGIRCVLSEPQMDPKLATVILKQGYQIGELDPLGSEFPIGSDHYGNMMRALADGFTSCGD